MKNITFRKNIIFYLFLLSFSTFAQPGKDGALTISATNTVLNTAILELQLMS